MFLIIVLTVKFLIKKSFKQYLSDNRYYIILLIYLLKNSNCGIKISYKFSMFLILVLTITFLTEEKVLNNTLSYNRYYIILLINHL